MPRSSASLLICPVSLLKAVKEKRRAHPFETDVIFRPSKDTALFRLVSIPLGFPEAEKKKNACLSIGINAVFRFFKTAALFHLVFNPLDFPEAKKIKSKKYYMFTHWN